MISVDTMLIIAVNLLCGLFLFNGWGYGRHRPLALLFFYSGVYFLTIEAAKNLLPFYLAGYDPYYYSFYLSQRYILYLLVLYAFYHCFRQPGPLLKSWIAVLAAVILAIAFFTPGYGPWYYPARLLLFGTISLFATRALTERSLPLIYLSVFSAAKVVMDVFKFAIPAESAIYSFQVVLEPVINASLLIAFFLLIASRSLRSKFFGLLSLPRLIALPQQQSLVATTGAGGQKMREEDLEISLDEVEETFNRLASVAAASKKDFITVLEFSEIIGVSEEEGLELVDELGLRKIELDPQGRFLLERSQISELLESGRLKVR